VSSFLPVLRLGLVNPEGYIAFSLFPHLSAIPLGQGKNMSNIAVGILFLLVIGALCVALYLAWMSPLEGLAALAILLLLVFVLPTITQ